MNETISENKSTFALKGDLLLNAEQGRALLAEN